MSSKKTLITLTIISSLFVFCKTKKVDEHNVGQKDIITSGSKKTTEKIYNSDKSKLLILEYTLNKNPVITYNYSVINSKTKEELKKGVFTGDRIEWLDNNTLKCMTYIGMIKKENDLVLEEGKNQKKNYITIKIN
jgi:hypothetical protein